MFLRIAVAVTCSIAAFGYAQRRRVQGPASYVENRVNESIKKTRSYADLNISAPKGQEEEVRQPLLNSAPMPGFEGLCFESLPLGAIGQQDADQISKIVSKNLGKSDSSDSESKVTKLQSIVGTEITRLKIAVSEMRYKISKLEAQLLEYCRLKERQRGYVELESELIRKDAEIKSLHFQISALEANLLNSLSGKDVLEKELRMTKAKITQLQRETQNDASHTKAQLLLLKEQFGKLQEVQELNLRKKVRLETSLQELEAEVAEFHQRNKELLNEKQELDLKLAAAGQKIMETSIALERDEAASAEAEAFELRHANNNIRKAVEDLQMSRFAEVEELVYLRWVNACLRHELDMYKASSTSLDHSESEGSCPASPHTPKQSTVQKSTRPDLTERGNSLKIVCSKPLVDPALDDIPLSRSSSGKQASKTASPHKQERNRHLITSYRLSLSSDSEALLSNTTPKPRCLSASSISILEAYLQGKSGEDGVSSKNGSKGFNKATSRFSSSASFANRYDLGGSPFDASKRKIKLPRQVSPRVAAGSDAGQIDVSETVAASFQHLCAASRLNDKHPSFKDLHKRTQVNKESTRVENLVNSVKEEVQKENSTCLRIPQTREVVDKSSTGDSKNVSAHSGLWERPLINKPKLIIEVSDAKGKPATPKPSDQRSIARTSPPGATHSTSEAPTTLPFRPSMAKPAFAAPPIPNYSVSSQLQANEEVQRPTLEVEDFQSPVRKYRETSTDALSKGTAKVAITHRNLIREIEDQSTFLQAVRADVETKGVFVHNLAREIRAADPINIEDVIAFVKWLDEELLHLVDERAVLKHFDWPEEKVDVLRDAAFEFQGIKTLEIEISSYEDENNVPSELALKAMLALQEKTEDCVYSFLQSRDLSIARYMEFKIPTCWMLDSGLIGKIKLGSIQLARKYMNTVVAQLDVLRSTPDEDSLRDLLLLQAAEFAFRVYQFAGGFDSETMGTFEGLKSKADGYLNPSKI